jgi:hypothetical protein
MNTLSPYNISLHNILFSLASRDLDGRLEGQSRRLYIIYHRRYLRTEMPHSWPLYTTYPVSNIGTYHLMFRSTYLRIRPFACYHQSSSRSLTRH